jgi:F-type H+-transporting ATPase subunit a
MRALRLLLLSIGLLGWGLLGGLPSAVAQEGQGQGKAAAPADPQQPAVHDGQHGAPKSTLEMSDAEIFADLHGEVVPHVVWPHLEPGEQPPFWAIYNVNVWQGIAIALALAVMLAVKLSFRRPGRPGWLTRVFRGWCRWVRDEMVCSVMGKEEGRAWTPFFLFLFFFVCGQNLVGMVPGAGGIHPVPATSTPYVTGALALVTFALMLGFGMKKNGVLGFFKGLLPHGLPVALVPLMLPIELIGLFVKPFALTVRLFANMLSGHLVIGSLIGLIFVFTKMFGGSVFSYVTAVPATGMAAFIYIIESFVVLLQAYIFTYLSIIFLHQAIHQEH